MSKRAEQVCFGFGSVQAGPHCALQVAAQRQTASGGAYVAAPGVPIRRRPGPFTCAAFRP